MFHCGSPRKRKNNNVISEQCEPSSSSKRPRQNISLSPENESSNLARMERVREIINKEFIQEMKSKENQLDYIDDRLDEAHTMLNRLRYAIVAEYYKKQEQPQLMIEATKTVQNASTPLQNESAIQIAMHPSLKKIIGKRPTNLEDIMKACPKRVAAQNAKHGICTKTASKRREEKIKRDQSIATDQSKVKQEPSYDRKPEKNSIASSLSCLESPNPHALNSYRIGNKSKYLFVVGNTSKYISNADSQVVGNVSLTHKWLVYVQTKDTDVPISKYIKKVRFFLHPSYRPNDIIDVHAPPFQVARRGWGEFPMRIQLFFHDRFQQKPVQLIHRVVLDTSKSGRHTLGAETVMEVWLREELQSRYDSREKTNFQSKNVTQPVPSPKSSATESSTSTITSNKRRTISMTSIKEPFDDNFMDFLNKIEETRTSICADIEKIEPTVVVGDSLGPQLENVHRSPVIKNETRSPLKRTPTQLSPYRTRAAIGNAQNIVIKSSPSLVPKTIKNVNAKLQDMIDQANVPNDSLAEPKKLETQKSTNISSTTNAPLVVSTANELGISVINNAKKIAVPSPSGKVFSNASGTVILPVTKPQQPIQQNQSTNNILNCLTTNSVFHKKIVQIVDAQGKTKTVQMLVATPKTLQMNVAKLTPEKGSTSPSTQSTNVIHGNAGTKPLLKNLVTANPMIIKSTGNLVTGSCVAAATPAAIAKTTARRQEANSEKAVTANNLNNVKASPSSSLTKNIVFQKEGKLYIIDPMQMKLKQQQKNQVSLLKPQVKQQQQHQSNIITTIAFDHDYVSLPQKSQTSILITGKKTEATANLLRTPHLHLGLRDTRLNVIRAQDLIKLRKIQFEKRFFRINFSSMRAAVEYLLRRLPLNVLDKESPAATFPFVCTAPQDFRSLPAFKQRSFEWLRASFIARLLRNLQSLQEMDATKQDRFWSTREIATFARYFAYTPPLKSLHTATTEGVNAANATQITMPGSKEHISALIKNEMQSEQLHVEYDSLSPVTGMQEWLERMQQQLQQHQELLAEDEIIVADSESSPEAESQCESIKAKSNFEDIITKRIFGSPLKFESANSKISYLPPLARLETASQFVGEICKDFSIRLQPEEIVPGVVHPVAQTLLAHILKVFVDRLLRQAIANQTQDQQRSTAHVSDARSSIVDRCITFQGLRKAIIDSNELDFLTNRHFGVSNNQIKHE